LSPSLIEDTHRQTHSKVCNRCGVERPLMEFHRHNVTKDGTPTYHPTCAACYAKRRRATPLSEEQRDRRREWFREYRAQWRKDNPDLVAAEQQLYKQKYPERYQARQEVLKATRKGLLPKIKTLNCMDCGKPAQSYDHHKGYAPENALDVQPLCRVCHGRRDSWRGEHASPRKYE